MTSEDLEKLRNLTENQAKFLHLIFLNGPINSGASGYSGPLPGKVAAELYKDGFIEHMGFKGRQRKWDATPYWRSFWNNEQVTIGDFLARIEPKS